MGNQSQDEVFLAAQEAVGAHRDSQGSTRFYCNRCVKSYSAPENLRRHQRVECGKEKKIRCGLCSQRFFYKQQLKKHIEKRHSGF
jgi:DNA-directed RNA polymerase subunit RPC12/RpoP